MKIRTRLFITFLILVGLGFYKLVDWITDDLRPRYLESMEESMVDTATILSAFVEQQATKDAINVADLRSICDAARRERFSARIYQVTKTQVNMRVYVTDRNGLVIFDSDNGKDEGQDYSQWNDVLLTMRGEYGARTTRCDPDDPRTAILYVASPIRIEGEIAGVLTVCKSADSVTLFLEMARKKIVLAGIIAALAVMFLGILTSFWITRPIQKLADYANTIRDGRRVAAPKLGRNEIGELGMAFEEMRDALEGKRYVEHYVQTMAHEMKSPLSVIRGAVELLEEEMPDAQRKQFLDNIRRESGRIQDFIDRLLQLSSLEKRKGLRDVEEIDLIALAGEVVESMNPVVSAKRITITMPQKKKTIVIKGEKFLIRQSISNLLQNAVDFSATGSEITVAIEKKDTMVELSISDNGPGVPDYALGRAFDRFYSLSRPDTGKKSSGLGLTFVREAALLHGGKAKLENRPEHGAKAILLLPAFPSETGS